MKKHITIAALLAAGTALSGAAVQTATWTGTAGTYTVEQASAASNWNNQTLTWNSSRDPLAYTFDCGGSVTIGGDGGSWQGMYTSDGGSWTVWVVSHDQQFFASAQGRHLQHRRGADDRLGHQIRLRRRASDFRARFCGNADDEQPSLHGRAPNQVHGNGRPRLRQHVCSQPAHAVRRQFANQRRQHDGGEYHGAFQRLDHGGIYRTEHV